MMKRYYVLAEIIQLLLDNVDQSLSYESIDLFRERRPVRIDAYSVRDSDTRIEIYNQTRSVDISKEYIRKVYGYSYFSELGRNRSCISITYRSDERLLLVVE